MIKFKLDLDLNDKELVDGIKSHWNSAIAALMGSLKSEGERLAASRLKTGLSKWRKGFKVDRVTDDFYIISVDGQLANWMEDGIQPGEISRSIMQGNRADFNKAQGKNYVDVPIAKDADSLTSGGKSAPKVNIQSFRDAASLIKSINTSDWKRGGVRQEKRVIQRVQDIIKSFNPESGQSSFLTIRRVTDDSQWPSSPFAGAKVLNDLDSYIDQNFDSILARFL